jgi:hypothetical protein
VAASSAGVPTIEMDDHQLEIAIFNAKRAGNVVGG